MSLVYYTNMLKLDLYKASSLKQQSVDIKSYACRLTWTHYPDSKHSPQCCMLSGEATNTNFKFSLHHPCSQY